jgi:hypothetical protein
MLRKKLRFGNKTMESEQVVKKSKSAWRMLFVGFLFGVFVSLLVLVIITFKYGPSGESNSMDLYSGHVITQKFFLWKHSQITGPNFPHVQWAIQHQNPVKRWYLPVSGSRAGWFERKMNTSYSSRQYVSAIYSLEIPEEEKIKLLHQYHKELDALKLKEKEVQQEISKLIPITEPFYKNWEQKLEKIKNDMQ